MCNVHMVVGAQCSFRSLHIFKIDMVELMESDKKWYVNAINSVHFKNCNKKKEEETEREVLEN